MGLFFIGIGAGVDAGHILEDPLGITLLTLALVTGKAAILFILAWLFRLRGRDRWIFTLGLAQGGEFGFVLIAYALSLGVMGDPLAQTLFLVVALSMLMTPFLFLALERLLRGQAPTEASTPDPIDYRHPVIIAGTGRFGRNVNRLLRSAGQEALLLDTDLGAVQAMRGLGHRVFLGDPTRPDLLASAGIAEARVLVVALDDREAATRLVALARRQRPDLRIIARAQDTHHAHALTHAGADETLREVFDSALRAARHTLETLGLDPQQIAEAERAFTHHDRTVMQELARFWQPDLPLEKNEAYRARAKELHDQLEATRSERHSAGSRDG